jgi:hypothetical protein
MDKVSFKDFKLTQKLFLLNNTDEMFLYPGTGGKKDMSVILEVTRFTKQKVVTLGSDGNKYYFSLKTGKESGGSRYTRPVSDEELAQWQAISAYNAQVEEIRKLLETPKYWPGVIALFSPIIAVEKLCNQFGRN